MFTQSKISVDECVASEVVKLYHTLDRGRGGVHGTWHSRKIRRNPYPWFDATFNRVAEAIGELTIDEWWFNCGAPEDDYRWHTHNPHKWVGVLYIQTQANSGAIEFNRQEEYQTFIPSREDFLLFSGNLAHRVLKNHSDNFRISVAFNFKS
jgi:hypothetical protein